MGHLSELSKWLTASVGCCFSFFAFTAGSGWRAVGPSVCQSVSLPYCKWFGGR